jgi:23S rRNA (pseudouridine1915-N3)-methyltransferase
MPRALRQVDFICVGQPNDVLAGAIAEYEQRVGALTQLRVAQVPGGPADMRSGDVSEEARTVAATIEAIEAERGGPFAILLADAYGDLPTSEEFAATWGNSQYLCFVIGGMVGLHDLLAGRDIRRVSFGRITMSPSLARLVALDMLYRTMRVGDGLPYDLN